MIEIPFPLAIAALLLISEKCNICAVKFVVNWRGASHIPQPILFCISCASECNVQCSSLLVHHCSKYQFSAAVSLSQQKCMVEAGRWCAQLVFSWMTFYYGSFCLSACEMGVCAIGTSVFLPFSCIDSGMQQNIFYIIPAHRAFSSIYLSLGKK